MAKNLDLTLLPLYRLRGNELPSPPGLQALTPPRRPARGRDKDRLIVHLTLGGNAPFSTVNYLQMTSAAAEEFYQTPGSVTSALRAAAIALNGDILERNMELSGQGRYSVGNLILCALRGDQLYILESGPTHVYWMADQDRVHIHEASLSGRGLGMGQATNAYLSQLTIRAGGRLLLTPKFPPAWEQILQRDNHTAPLEILRNALMRQSTEDENAVLIEITAGRGLITVLKPKRQPQPTLEIITKKLEEEPSLPEHPERPFEVKSHQPEPLPVESSELTQTEATEVKKPALAPKANSETKSFVEQADELLGSIPLEAPKGEDLSASRQDNESKPPMERTEDVFASIPRQRAVPAISNEFEADEDVLESIPRRTPEPVTSPPPIPEMKEEIVEPVEEVPTGPSTSEVVARKSARALAKGMQATRESNQKLKAGFNKLLPRLLPSDDSETPVRLSTRLMGLIAVVIPLIVVTVASLVYFRFGRDERYENYLTQAKEAGAHAEIQSDPLAERLAWEDVLTALDLAEDRKVTDETRALRTQAQEQIDSLLNILRLDFKPAVSDLPRGIHITRIAANDSELFLLDANTGSVLRAYLVGDGYQYDDSFVCEAGNYGGKNIGKLVEIQILPKANAFGASILAFDAQGGLLYCAWNEYPQATYLAEPAVGFRDITAVALQSDVLYVLDAPSREVWVYGGQASTFINYPTAFFSTETPEEMEIAVDMSINDTDLYLLFNDGHLATCTYSLLESVPTRCINPVQLVDTNPASGGGNNFGEALFSEIHISEPPDSAILLLAAESQSIFRFSPRYYELLSQLKASSNTETNLPAIALSAMTSNPNHRLFIALEDQLYMAMDTP